MNPYESGAVIDMKDGAKAATPHDELIAELLDSRVPKTEREHAATREIERLRALVGEMREDIMSWLEHSENTDAEALRTPEEEYHSNELIFRANAALAADAPPDGGVDGGELQDTA